MSSAEISVTSTSPSRWRVDVRAGAATSHDVTLPAGYLDAIGLPAAAPEKVIEESFRFLLEREPNTSILREFSLPVIERFFPEYRREIARRLQP